MLKKDMTILNRDSRNSYHSKQAYDGYINSILVDKQDQKSSAAAVNKNISNKDILAAVNHEEQLSNITEGNSKVLSAINNLTAKYSVKDMKNSHNIVTTNKTENTFIEISEEESSTGVFAPSDPDRVNKTEDELSYIYKIKKQEKNREPYKIPKNAPKINTEVNAYKDRRSMKYLSDDNIAVISEEGIITVNQRTGALPSFKLIPEEDLVQVPIENNTRKMTPYVYKDIAVGNDLYYDDTVPEGIRANREKRYYYKIGIDDIFLGKKEISAAGGFISSQIYVGNCVWISLSADCETAEYYIIDEKEEIPILPDTQEKIINEKLFFGMMPRFPLADQNNFTVKKNGIATSIKTIPELRLFLFSKTTQEGKSGYETVNNYTIDYMPPLSYRQYTPKSDTVRLKIILRKNDLIIPKITKCQINIYQPENKWAMSSTEDIRLETGSW